jgi:MFS family permease
MNMKYALSRLIMVLYLISVLEVVARNLFGPFYAVYVERIGGDPISSGTAVAINSAVVGLFIVIFGRVAARYKTEKLQMVIGFGISALVYLSYIFIDHPWQLFILEAISGIAVALSLPAFSGLYSAALEKGKHSSDWGDYFGFMNLVSAVTLFSSGVVVQKLGFNTLFVMMFIFQLLGMLASIYLFKLKVPEQRSETVEVLPVIV